MQTITSSYSFSPKSLRFQKFRKPLLYHRPQRSFMGSTSYSNKTLETIQFYRSGLSHNKKLSSSIKFFSNLEKKKQSNDFLTTLYSQNNFENAEREISTKYNIYTSLSEIQKERIKLIFKKVPRNISITTSESNYGSSYSDPFNSQKVLNLNKEVYNAVSNIRIENQFDSFNKKIKEINRKKQIIKLMPKIRISKLTSIPFLKNYKEKNTITGTITIDSKINKKKESKISLKKIPIIENMKKIRNNYRMISRDKLSNELKIIFNIIHSQYHPSSRGSFSLSTTENGTIYIYGGYQSKSFSDLWKCNIKKKEDENQILLSWEKINEKEENSFSRYGHSMTYYQDNLYIFGGNIIKNGNLYSNKKICLCIFDLKKGIFFYPENNNYIPWRKNHIGIGIGNTILIHGGINEEGEFLNEIWIYEILRKKWSNLNYKNIIKIPKISNHSCALVLKNPSLKFHKDLNVYKFPEGNFNKFKGNKPKIEGIYIFGGIEENGNFYKDLWLIRIGNKPCEIGKIPFKGIGPCERINCGISFFNPLNFLVIYGGRNSNLILNDIWIFDLEYFNWIKPNYDQCNSRFVCEHSIFEYDDKIFVLGGSGNFGFEKFDFYTIEFDVYENNNNSDFLSNFLQ